MRRIVLFAHYDRDGRIDDYVLYYLKHLRSVADRILFVSDCNLLSGEAAKLDGSAELVFAGRHEEYDFGSWRRGFAFLDYDLSEWDELIIANDSCFAPLFPIAEAFLLIGKCDFWGATKELYSFVAAEIAARRGEQRTSPCPGEATEENFHFVNSYFMVFKKKILQDAAFTRFWRDIKRLEDKDHVIESYEVGLSKLLIGRGYKHSCFAVRGPAVVYEDFEVPVPVNFNLPWLRALLCKENKERVLRLSEELDRIDYPRPLIDDYMKRIVGTAEPSHYFLGTGRIVRFAGMVRKLLPSMRVPGPEADAPHRPDGPPN